MSATVYFRKSQQRLARQQRKLRNMKVGSKNREKQNRKVAKVYRHIANQRKDFLHKESAAIAKRCACVVVEDLDMKAIGNKSFHIGKATMDNGFGMFCGYLDYKLRDRGGQLIHVDRWYPSSQICSCCGARKKMELEERVYKCPVCGHVMDRDLNAAINIQREGLRMLSA